MSQEYVNKLTAEQKKTAAAIVAEAKKKGVSNQNALTALLTIASKETEFGPRTEDLKYSAARITEVWPKIPLNIAKSLENNPEKLGNYVYGPAFNPSLGNGPGEGYKYRGRGPGQLTGRRNYESMSKKIGVDLVSNPDLVNHQDVYPKVFVQYYIDAFAAAARLKNNSGQSILSEYNTKDINGFTNLKDSVNAFYDATRGWGNRHKQDTTGGYAKATARAPFLAQLINYTVEHKSGIGAGVFFLSASALAFAYRKEIVDFFKTKL